MIANRFPAIKIAPFPPQAAAPAAPPAPADAPTPATDANAALPGATLATYAADGAARHYAILAIAAAQSEGTALNSNEQGALNALLALAEPARPITPAVILPPQTATAEPALYCAARDGDLAQVQSLIAAGHNVNETERTTRYTPLHIAARRGNLAVVQALLDAGADPTLRTALGQTTVNCANASHKRPVIDLVKNALRNWGG